MLCRAYNNLIYFAPFGCAYPTQQASDVINTTIKINQRFANIFFSNLSSLETKHRIVTVRGDHESLLTSPGSTTLRLVGNKYITMMCRREKHGSSIIYIRLIKKWRRVLYFSGSQSRPWSLRYKLNKMYFLCEMKLLCVLMWAFFST